ncbi:hypothetical protein H7J86_26125 [Mycobacterium hackensackense]|uniref:hypothetical protein n=1 Tax=Mycobacterium hackensackense TaxID=228909 RepID=UPI002265880A|nr:hypothetical protein [Mycobacterium hackensackense]MCV7255646.1 hypothetical protein [Mycobacterium hackensackense]
MTKQFEIGPIVTVLHGDENQIFCPLQQLNDILGFMTGDVPTAEPNDIDGVDSIGEAITRCRPHLAALFPELAAEPEPVWPDVTDPSIEAEVVTWLVQLGAKYHTPLTVPQLPEITRAAALPPEPEPRA